MKEIDAVIFDLGGVIINLDYKLTAAAFIKLGLADFDNTYSQIAQTDLFDNYETGKISTFHFINRILDLLPRGCNGNQVVHAWNAMILDFPKERLELLENTGKEKRIFLLSNTNDIHMDAVRRSLANCRNDKKLEDYFEKVYLSCEMGLRKPDPEIFKRVCEEQNLDPKRTLFIDDSPQHIEGAKSIGLETLYLEKEMAIENLDW